VLENIIVMFGSRPLELNECKIFVKRNVVYKVIGGKTIELVVFWLGS
jgi:hypothetical protein